MPLQPQLASFMGKTAKGFLPVPGQASLFVEIAPGIAINRVTDVALKATKGGSGAPGGRARLRSSGSPRLRSGEVRQAGSSILNHLRDFRKDRYKPAC